MELLKVILLGVIQGLTEFLPVSSSGHLIIFQQWFGINEAALSLDVVLHLGTLFSVLFYYQKRIRTMLKKPFSRYNMLILLTAVPAGIVGVLFSDFFKSVYASANLLGPAFLFTAVVLYLSSLAESKNTIGYMGKTRDNVGVLDILFIGLMQCLAIFPGISRSGSTISAGLFRNVNKEIAAEISFLNSIILILGANVLEVPALLSGNINISIVQLFAGFLASALSGYLAISFMIKLLQKHSLRPFAYYVAALGLFILLDGSVLHLIF
ncbi:undecaprenyl-diphosphate phosphatase [Clostridia bacterium]|nr:undecaprenyl-diphosphate phosphatase [Clostridia bacterium]